MPSYEIKSYFHVDDDNFSPDDVEAIMRYAMRYYIDNLDEQMEDDPPMTFDVGAVKRIETPTGPDGQPPRASRR